MKTIPFRINIDEKITIHTFDRQMRERNDPCCDTLMYDWDTWCIRESYALDWRYYASRFFIHTAPNTQTSPDPCSDVYHGPKPFSEPESKHVS